jgi:predicted metalloprotease with PDZ domain
MTETDYDDTTSVARQISVVYHVRVRPRRHELEVELTITGPPADGTLSLATPTWVPGNYEFAPFGRDVFAVRAADAHSGVALRVHRAGWHGYRIEGCSGSARITWRAHCKSNNFSESCGVLGDHAGVLLGTRYLRVTAYDGPCRVTYELPAGWKLHHPSGAKLIRQNTYDYPNYEILLDTPVVLGNFHMFTRSVRSTPFHHVFLDGGVGFASQAEAFVDKVVAVAEAYHDIFGAFPFGDYTFIMTLNPAWDWGLEHLTSTMVGLGPRVFTDPDQNAIGVRVCAHELFHAWNVRRLRPAPLGDLDFERGSFTEGLWVAEGFTRYFEFLICTRTQVYSPAQFLSTIVNYHRHLSALPAYRRVSAVDSSAASYLNHAKYPGRVNNSIDYYDKGMLIAFGLDVALRQHGCSLDHAFRAFYEEYVGRGAGYTTEDIRGFLNRIRVGLGDELARQATNPGELETPARLEQLGFKVADEAIPYFGLVMQDDTGPAIYGVLDDSPAGESGIAAEDVVTAVDNRPFDLGALKWAAANAPSVTLDVLRGNAPQRYVIKAGSRTQIGALTWNGTAAQAEAITGWLGQRFEPAAGGAISLDFYENFHGIETVI